MAVKSKEPSQGKILKMVYLESDQLSFIQDMEKNGVIKNRSQLIRACIDFARKSNANLKQVLDYVQE